MRVKFLLAIALIPLLVFTLFKISPVVQAQNLVDQVIWSKGSGEIWKSSQDGTEQGTAWRQIGFNDSSWVDEAFRFYAIHGSVPNSDGRGYYFRKEFEVSDLQQIVSIQAELYYDDAAVLFLNGQEVYRTIRNNLPTDPELSIFQSIPYGGLENYYVRIPADSNLCETGCTDTSTEPIPVDLLVEGTNVFGIMVWDRGGSDLGVDLELTFTRDLNIALDNIVINEFLASNGGVLLDEDFDSSDWIELHNTSNAPVNLGGWTLSDLGTEWTFPNVTIAADEYLIVFASDKNRAIAGSELHTNFKLSKENDALTLVDPDGYVIDEYAVTDVLRQFQDVSWGRANNNENNIGYLNAATPGTANSGIGSNYAPVLRKFSDRIYNVGEPVSVLADGFDPDGLPISHTMVPSPPGISIIAASGEITGTATQAGTFSSEIRIIDSDNMTDTESVDWFVFAPPQGPTRLVLNEYNAVPPDRLLVAGEDPAFGSVLGNGGDWFEFVVVEDGLDLRGWEIELWDRDRTDDLLGVSATLIFNQRAELASLPAGTIITISETEPDDIGLYPPGDWHINLQANDLDEGDFFTPESQENFNSSRANQVVILRNASGGLESPAVGETDAWDDLIGGVGGGEVMSNCTDPSRDPVDPLADYDDNGEFSSFGAPNRCRVINDPLDLNDDQFFVQDLGALRDGDGDGILDSWDNDADNDGLNDLTESRKVKIINWLNAGSSLSNFGNRIIYTGTSVNWTQQINSARFSTYGFSDNYQVSWRILTAPTGHQMIGVGRTEFSPSFADIDFAFYNLNGNLSIREGGVGQGTVGTIIEGSKLSIAINDGQLSYLLNGNVVRTVVYSGTPDFYIDSSFQDGAMTFSHFEIEPLPGRYGPEADSDGVKNRFDLDSDNDTIPDVVEAGLTDVNNDFLLDDLNNQGSAIAPPDSDGDMIPDYLDLESTNATNNGTAFDIASGPYAALDTNGNGWIDSQDAQGGVDNDSDGIDDAIDRDPTRIGSPTPWLLGDVNCDELVDTIDALYIMQSEVLLRDDVGICPLFVSASQFNASRGDVNADGATNVADSLFIMQCEVNITNSFCP